jgi:hypothetical protein
LRSFAGEFSSPSAQLQRWQHGAPRKPSR